MTATLDQLIERSGGTLESSGEPTGHDLDSIVVIDATHDSRQVAPGWLFFCVPGASVDGHDFAESAITRGAVALVVDHKLDVTAPQIVVSDVRSVMGPVSALVHGDPSAELTVVGVTGTNGKSSIVQLLADIWSQVGMSSEIIGTLVGARTTPEGPDLQRQFRRAADRGIRAMAIEVSSHALALHRVAGTRFACSVFTNLTQDHLDFHHTMEEYFAAKATLFTPELSASAVVNRDDTYGNRLIEAATVQTTSYGITDADDLVFDRAISRFRWRDHEVVLQLAGSHNVLNALAAASCAELLGMESVDIADALCATSPVRGRFEAVDAGQSFHIAVDYAHTPDALDAALAAARQVAGNGQVLVVFGCGGDRDPDKRAEMGHIAQHGADIIIVTSDNPRSEDPLAIINNILEGIDDRSAVIVEPDRQSAINAAIAAAADGDMVLIAGKGHETYQIIGEERIDFDDRRAALTALGVAS